MDCWILIPARNEAARIGGIVRAIRETMGPHPCLVVDGHSTDDTVRIAEASGADVIPQQGQGYAAALRTGYAAALARNAQMVVQLDADGQHPVSGARAVADALQGVDWAIGSRDGTGSPGTWGRRIGAWTLRSALYWNTGNRFRDPTSGLQALGPRALRLFVEQLPDIAPDTGARVLAARAGLRTREVAVWMPERSEGASMHDGWTGVRNGWRSLRWSLGGESA